MYKYLASGVLLPFCIKAARAGNYHKSFISPSSKIILENHQALVSVPLRPCFARFERQAVSQEKENKGDSNENCIDKPVHPSSFGLGVERIYHHTGAGATEYDETTIGGGTKLTDGASVGYYYTMSEASHDNSDDEVSSLGLTLALKF